MSSICAILTCQAGDPPPLRTLEQLIRQKPQPDHLVLITDRGADSAPTGQAATALAERCGVAEKLHLLTARENAAPPRAGSACGLDYAFRELSADYAWILAPGLLPLPGSLAALLAAPAGERRIRQSLVIHPASAHLLGRPIAISTPPGSTSGWKLLRRRDELPGGPLIPCRGNLAGALYPRSVWEEVGCPIQERFLCGADEEYPWRARQAGYRYLTVSDSELRLACASAPLRQAQVAGYTYLYEPGLPLPLFYEKLRNWAWLERLQRPRAHLSRLLHCGGCILFTISSILQSGEASIPRLYNVFRALHNGFYGKLRPY